MRRDAEAQRFEWLCLRRGEGLGYALPDRLSRMVVVARRAHEPELSAPGAERRERRRGASRRQIAILVLTLLAYVVTNYGGIRGPDEEVMFRAGEALLDGGGLAVAHDLESWPGFGVARGRDGRLYSVFGPLQSILCAPLIALGRHIAATGWYVGREGLLPVSFYVGHGTMEYLRHLPPAQPYEAAVRLVVSFYNVLVCTAVVAVFCSVCALLIPSPTVVLVLASLLGLGTPLWSYAGKFNSEPTALLFALIALYELLRVDPRVVGGDAERGAPWRGLGAGAGLGLATAAHVSAFLFAPFFALYGAHSVWRQRGGRWTMAAFAAGCGALLAALAYYDWARFGSVWETGRTVSLADARRFAYGHFVLPWHGLLGLLLSPGKGLLLYCPAVVLGLLTWRHLHAKAPALSLALAAAILFRVVFIASRSDWHGGFCLGPRLLLLVVPFAILPLGLWMTTALRRRRWGSLAACAAAILACISEQLYFALGEISSYYRVARNAALVSARPIPVGDRFYFEWAYAPLGHLLQWRRGPLLLQRVPVSNDALWLGGTLVVWTLLALLVLRAARREGWFEASR